MHRKPVFPAFAAAFAALVAGCEWSGTSSSDSWSGSYDAMNFSGTYRAATTLESGSSSSSEGTSKTVRETVGTYEAGTYRYSGQLSHTPVDLATVQIQLGGITYTGDGSGNLVSDYGSGKVTAAGAWSVDVTAPSESSSSSTTGGHTAPVKGERLGKVAKPPRFNATLANSPLVPGSVSINLDNGISLQDDGNQNLTSTTPNFGGIVTYATGEISLNWQSAAQVYQTFDGEVTATYKYYYNQTSTSTAKIDSPLTGSGSIVAVYSYTENATAASSGAVATTSTDITSITVSQSGQNLTMSTNTGIQMSGKFTAVRETSGSSEAGVSTYNAQFQVSSASGHKFVGTLNYDLPTSRRTLNGTLTAGKAVYDIQGVGPAFSSSAN